ncbi:RTA1 like protein-domain-containing protein [Chytriomyces cf. hyalinus JEL632]|nr:RTA1 like protein-domain-containing protein [Chytriomyces cf. hyalinus JEL632]
MTDRTHHPDGSINYEASPYGEQPRLILAQIAAGVFVLLFLVHLGQAIRFKTRYMGAAIAGCLMEAIGYTSRCISIDNPFQIATYASQHGLIVISPVLVAATQYVMLEKVIHHSYPEASPVKHTLITKVFVIGDVIAFFVQIAGSGMLLSDPKNADLGIKVLMAGLVVQVISFALYLSIATLFYLRAMNLVGHASAGLVDDNAWRTVFAALMVSGGFVFLRSVFRIVEFSYGFRGFIATNEIYLYVFDFALMALALLAFNVYHPGKYLRARVTAEYRTMSSS